MRLSHTGEQEAAVAIPETLVDRVRSAPARVEFWALPGVEVGGELARTVAQRRSDDAHLSGALQPGGRAAPMCVLGMSLTVTLADKIEKVARLPLGALFDEGDGPSLWVVDRASGAVTQTPRAHRRL